MKNLLNREYNEKRVALRPMAKAFDVVGSLRVGLGIRLLLGSLSLPLRLAGSRLGCIRGCACPCVAA